MRRPGKTLWFPGMVVLMSLVAARGQGSSDSRLNSNARFPDVYLNDSFEANDAIRRARRMQTAQRWEEAARAYRRIAAEYADSLVRLGDDYYVNVAEFVNQQLASWPEAGLDVYRALFEPQAEAQLDRADRRRDLHELLVLFDAFFCTDAAAKAADRAAQIALEDGNCTLAIEIYEKLLARHPRGRSLSDPIAVRLAVANVWAGRKEKAKEVLGPLLRSRSDLRVPWLGREISATDLLQLQPLQPAASETDAAAFFWPIFAGDASRNRQPVSAVRPGAPLWSFDQFQTAPAGREGRADPALRSARARGRSLVFQPVCANGLIYFHDAQHVWALNAVSGTLAWTYGLPAQTGRQPEGNAESSPPELFTCTIDGRRLFADMGYRGQSFYSSQPAQSPTLLVCLDAFTGELLWQLDRKALSGMLQDLDLDGPPLAHDGKLHVVGRRSKTFGFQDCYLLQIDGRTGRPDWHLHLASASVGGPGYILPTLTYPAVNDDLVFVQTQLGAIAAVSAHSGRIRWLRLYPRSDLTNARLFRSRSRKVLYPWQYNPVICSQTKLLAAPMDSDQVLVLRQGDGAVLQQIDKEKLHDVACVLGIAGEKLFGVGSHVFAWDLESNRDLWAKPLGQHHLYGRPFLAQDRIYVPAFEDDDPQASGGALLTYDLAGNLIHDRAWNAAAEGGNILATPDQIIVAGERHITAYAAKEEVFARLQRRIEADPRDPSPMLDLAEIAFRIQEYARATEALDLAAERVGGLTQLSEPKLKRRFYRDALSFADALLKLDPPRVEEAVGFCLRAAQCPPDIDAHIEYRMRLADALQRSRRNAEAVGFYQQILLDPSLRNQPSRADDDTPPAGRVAENLIRELIKVYGRDIYQRFEDEARAAHLLARDRQDLEALANLADSYPNSTAAPEALIDRAGLLRRNGQPRQAARVYYQALTRYADQVDPANLIRLIAESYHQAGKNQSAAAWLSKGMREHPDAGVTISGRRLSFEEYRSVLLGKQAAETRTVPGMQPVGGEPSYSRQFDAAVQILQPRFLPARPDILFVYTDKRIEAYAVRDNRPLWPAPVSCQMTPMFLGFDENLAIFATKHQILAVDTDTGKIAWTFGKYPAELDKPDADHEWFASWSTHTLISGRLVSLQDGGLISCLQTRDGRMLWQVQPENKPAEPMCVTEEFVIYRSPGQTPALFPILDVDTGKTLRVLAPRKAGDDSTLFLAVTPEGVLLMATAKDILAFDPYNGRLLWTVHAEGSHREATFQFGLDGFFLSETGNTLTKRSSVDGRKIWESSPIRSQVGVLTAMLYRDELYALTNRDVVSLDPNTGQEQWVGIHGEDIHFTHHFLTDPYFVAIDERKAEDPTGSEKVLTAYFYDRTGYSGQLPENGQQVLGRFSRLKGVSCYENTLIVLDGQTFHAFRPGNR